MKMMADTAGGGFRAGIDHSTVQVLNILSRGRPDDVDNVINIALKMIGELCGFDRTYVFVLRDEVFVDNSHEWTGPGIEPMIDALQGLPTSLISDWFVAFARGDVIHIPQVDNLPDDHLQKATLQMQDIKSLLVVPMQDDTKVIGFVGYDAVVAERQLDERDVFFMRSVANGIAALLLKVRAIAIADANIETQRKLAAVANEARSQRDIAINALPDGFVLYDSNNKLVLCNERYRDFSPNAATALVQGAAYEDILQAEMEHAESPNVERGTLSDHEHQLADGRWVRILNRKTPDGGRVGMRIDITDLKRAERRLTDVIEGAQVGTWEWDIATGVNSVNSLWASMLGYHVEELAPITIDTWERLGHPDDIVAARKALKRVFTDAGQQFEHTIRMRHKAGHWVWIMSRGRVVSRGTDGNAQVMAGVHIDISDQMAREQNLLAVNLQFEKAVAERDDAQKRFFDIEEISSDWFWEQDNNLRFTYLSKSFESTTGRLQGDFLGVTLAEIVGPRPWMRTDTNLRAFSETLATRQPFQNVIFQLSDDPDDQIWIRLSGAPFFDRDGSFLGYRGVGSDVTSLYKAKAFAEHLATHDPLTGLANRAVLQDHLQRLEFGDQYTANSAALMLLDIDNFKSINDSLGHDAGDSLLQLVAERLVSHVRETDLVARLGGDEFTILLPQAHEKEARDLANRLIDHMSQPFVLQDQALYATVSIGIALLPQDASTASEFLQNADIAMYRAKAAGRCQFTFFESKFRVEQHQRSEMMQALFRAVSERQFQLVLQPKFTTGSVSRLVGAEALLRWHDLAYGDVPPDKFIPLAESMGLMAEIDFLVLDLVSSVIAAQLEQGHRLCVAINVSAQSFHRENFAAELLDHLRLRGVPNELVLIEITETMLMTRTQVTFANIRRLQAEGIQLSIDDFGTGYSSFNYLQQLPLAELKIDRSFIAEIGCGNSSGDAIVSAILSMAEALELRCVAEGVETEAQFKWLNQNGCNIVQGHFVGRPLKVAAFVDEYLVKGL